MNTISLPCAVLRRMDRDIGAAILHAQEIAAATPPASQRQFSTH